MDTYSLLKQLTETPGPSGGEQPIAEQITRLWQPLTDEIQTDRIGTVLATQFGTTPLAEGDTRPSILLAAHQDELGFMVARIVEHNGYGFIRVTNLGGVDRRHLLGQTVIIHGRRELPAVLGGLPNHMLPEKDQNMAYSYENLVADPGLSADVLRELVSIGDFISFRQPLRQLLSGRTAGKALDNRASVAAVTICLELLQTRQHHWNVIAAATSQEETRLLGAYTSAYRHYPEAAIAIDVTHAKSPGANDSELPELGSGPALGIGANVHPALFSALRDAANSLEMNTTTEPHAAGSGTDAYAIQVAREGIPTGLVSIPLRYMHTMVETADITDIERVGRLLAETIARLDEHFVPNITNELMGINKKKAATDEEGA